MTRTLLAALFVSSLAGCAVVQVKSKPAHGSQRGALKSADHGCAPHQYWDGEICRHKGKGKGARKHDG